MDHEDPLVFVTLAPPSTLSEAFHGYPALNQTYTRPAIDPGEAGTFLGYKPLGDEQPICDLQVTLPGGAYDLTPTKHKRKKHVDGNIPPQHVNVQRPKRRRPDPTVSAWAANRFPAPPEEAFPIDPSVPDEHVAPPNSYHLVPPAIPKPDHARYDTYVDAVLAKSAGFCQLSPEIFVVQGWNTKSATTTVRETSLSLYRRTQLSSDDLVPSSTDHHRQFICYRVRVSASRDTMCPPSIFIGVWW